MKSFVGDDNIALILGDNIFYGENFSHRLMDIMENNTGATVFGYEVKTYMARGFNSDKPSPAAACANSKHNSFCNTSDNGYIINSLLTVARVHPFQDALF